MANLFSSSIGKKLIMSLSGLFLILFLTFHMSMNLVALISAEGYNMICEFLGANWYALAATAGLAGGMVIHIVYAFYLSMLNRKARGNNRYAVIDTPKEVTWASQNMLVLGIIVICGLALHLVNFWANMQLVEIMGHHEVVVAGMTIAPTDGAALIAYTFSKWYFVLPYIVWFAAIWFHLTHGFWSALQTIGWNNQIWFNRWRCIGNIFATVICLGFAAVTIIFYLQSLCSCCA